MRLAAGLLLVACGSSTPEPPPAPPAPPPPEAPRPPAAAMAFVATLSPDVVGTLVPGAPLDGDYAMSLHMTFETFVTTEMRIDDRLDGAMKLTLAADGSARACAGVHAFHEVEGQPHYRADHHNEHHASETTDLLGLAGTWSASDGIATIRFDRFVSSTCALGAAVAGSTPIQLRCVGAGRAPSKLPGGSVACEVEASSQLEALGMPMTARKTERSEMREQAPRGANIVLAPMPGVAVTVAQGSHASEPTFTFATPAAPFVDKAFLPPPRKP